MFCIKKATEPKIEKKRVRSKRVYVYEVKEDICMYVLQRKIMVDVQSLQPNRSRHNSTQKQKRKDLTKEDQNKPDQQDFAHKRAKQLLSSIQRTGVGLAPTLFPRQVSFSLSL